MKGVEERGGGTVSIVKDSNDDDYGYGGDDQGDLLGNNYTDERVVTTQHTDVCTPKVSSFVKPLR
jgi:hypothetical protein